MLFQQCNKHKKIDMFSISFLFPVFETRVYLIQHISSALFKCAIPPMADSHHTGKHKSTVLLFLPLHLSSNPSNCEVVSSVNVLLIAITGRK